MVIVKKYSNRRLYDTDESRYITLEELADRVRSGTDVRVVDAKTNADLTQQTLTQIILESRGAGKLLPVPLLTQLIRMEEEDLAQFLGSYMGWALELYFQAKRGASQLQPYVPFAGVPFQATNALARMFGNFGPWGFPGFAPPGGPAQVAPPARGSRPAPMPEPEPEPEDFDDEPPPDDEDEEGDPQSELAALRAQLEALEKTLRKKPR
ncbi:MAG: hypothetical protein H6721_16895 [Sandaracinus sp.]|nr:hypothetical protein [Sandaracinus sp.]MCB9625224.1 hypothetical protein [Sandaracinus sp.]MCB9633797.1 hypothetical protein [Sandaracinus sp.]